MKKVDMIVDLQFGSTGKGLIAGYLALRNKYDTVINANMPNAGHTFIDKKGQKMIFKVLPNGIVSHRCKTVMIGPGSVFNPVRLQEEITLARKFGYMNGATVYIHNNSVPLIANHVREEKYSTLSKIGSTQQGSMAAMVRKMQRDPDANVISRDVLGGGINIDGVEVKVVNNDEWRGLLINAKNVLAEGAQGFSLGIDEKFYPYCTSRNCTPARFASDMGIPLGYIRDVTGTARTYPIRVGGTSGGMYTDQRETAWDELGLEKEFTTVTKRERRVFTFSRKQIEDAMWAMEPDNVFLNFCNYVSLAELEVIMRAFGDKIQWLGHGPAVGDINEIQI